MKKSCADLPAFGLRGARSSLLGSACPWEVQVTEAGHAGMALRVSGWLSFRSHGSKSYSRCCFRLIMHASPNCSLAVVAFIRVGLGRRRPRGFSACGDQRPGITGGRRAGGIGPCLYIHSIIPCTKAHARTKGAVCKSVYHLPAQFAAADRTRDWDCKMPVYV